MKEQYIITKVVEAFLNGANIAITSNEFKTIRLDGWYDTWSDAELAICDLPNGEYQIERIFITI